MRIRIGDKIWTVTRRSPESKRGRWHGFADISARRIWIDPKLDDDPKRLRVILIHEWLHARFPDLAEDAVTQGAEQLDRLISRFRF